VGFGIPQSSAAFRIINGENIAIAETEIVKADTINLTGFSNEKEIVIFRKQDQRNVIRQQILKPENGQIKLRRIPGENFTTIDDGLKVRELAWQ